MTMSGNSYARIRNTVFQSIVVLLFLLPSGQSYSRTVEEIQTPSGLKVWLLEERSIPLVAVRFAFEGGSLHDPEGKAGLGSLMAALLSEGAGGLDSAAFARRLADEGAQLSFSVSRDQFNGGLDAISGRIEDAADLLRLSLVSPRFDVDAIERVKSQKIADLIMAQNEPRAIAFNRWYEAVFPGHPYGRPISGAPASVKSITQADLIEHHRRMFARSGLRIVIVGDIDRKAAIELVEKTFASLPARQELSRPTAVVPRKIAGPVLIENDQPLATAAFGAEAVPTNHADYPTLEVLRQVVGSGDFDSLLMDEIRVKRGLAYSVSLSLLPDTATSILLGGMGTKREAMPEAQRVLTEVLAGIAAHGPEREAFENAKRYLVGSYLLDLDTNAKLASTLMKVWLQGRNASYVEERNATIDAVTLDDATRVARQYLDPLRFSTIIVGRKTPPPR